MVGELSVPKNPYHTLQREGRDVYIFFDNDEAAHAVRDAQSIGKYLTENTRSASNLTD